jgi:Short-chain dehydrogenases of various substrate specificities
MKLAGATVLLTGATGGLGRAIAAGLAERGARLVLSSRKGPELEQLAAELPGEGHRAVVSDLAEPEAALRLVAEAGEIDVLVANAGLPASGRIEDMDRIHIERALRVNLEAPILMTHALLEPMRARGRGHFVYVSSLNGIAATARAALYSGTKFGLRGFALGLREDLRDTPLSASVVLPGLIRDAGMFADSGVKAPALGGTGTPGQVADAVVAAIERDRAEIAVAPLRQRAAARFAARWPELAGRLARVAGAVRVADAVASNQTDKR